MSHVARVLHTTPDAHSQDVIVQVIHDPTPAINN